MAASDLTNQVFGKLRAVEATEHRNHSKTIMWRCECLNCGATILVASTKLKEGGMRSCGCLQGNPNVRTPPGHSGFNCLYQNYMQGARRRNLEFSLTKEQFKELTQASCVYCGVAPASICYGSKGNRLEYGKYIYSGIDRLNSKIGYVLDNCVTSCAECNLAKGTRTYDEFVNWIRRVYNYL